MKIFIVRTNLAILESGSAQQQQYLLKKQYKQQQQETREENFENICTIDSTSTSTKTNVDTDHHLSNDNESSQNENLARKSRSKERNTFASNVSSDKVSVNGISSINSAQLLTEKNMQVQQINRADGNTSGKLVTKEVTTLANGYQDDGHMRAEASGSAKIQQTQSSLAGNKTETLIDGSTVTTIQSSKSSNLKYAVEAKTRQEQTIR